MRHKIALAKSALIAAICILPASLFAVTAAELNAFYQAKQYLKCYDAAVQASSEYSKSAVPVFYAAIALCHVDEDAALQKAVTQPWGKVLGLTEKAKARDPQGKQLGRYQSGLALIQQKLFEKVNAIYEVGDEGMVSQFQRIASVFNKRAGTWKNIFHFGNDKFDEEYDFEEWDNPMYRLANTAKNMPNLNEDQKVLILLHNLARMNPPLFEQTFVRRYYGIGASRRSFHPNAAVQSLQRELLVTKPMKPLFPEERLQKSSSFHAEDLSRNTIFGHSSSDGTSFSQRLESFVGSYSLIGENCQSGLQKPLDCILSLLVDAGTPSLGHRKNILHPRFDSIGIGIADHEDKVKIWVFDFARY